MGQIRTSRCGYEYVSDNGIVYDIGENGAEFNIIIDTFLDMDEMYEDVCFHCCFVDYVYGNMNDKDMIEWIDWRISRYENHERIARFDGYECYIGLKEEKHERDIRISKEQMEKKLKQTIQND